MGKPTPHAWLGYVAPLAGQTMALVAGIVWRKSLLRYQGAGHYSHSPRADANRRQSITSAQPRAAHD